MSELQVGDKVRKITAKGLSKYLYNVTFVDADGIHAFIMTTGGTGSDFRILVTKIAKVAE